MSFALTLLNVLLYVGFIILGVAVVLWALRYWNITIDPLIQKALVFLVIIFVLIIIVSLFAGVSFIPPIIPGPERHEVIVR
jgi:hypothetical protein